MSLQETDKKYIANTYNRFPVSIVSGKGSVVKDENGKEYIDLGSGIGVTSFGIADDVWQKAIAEQIGKVQHMSNLYYTEPCTRLAEMLCEKTGMKKVFFSNSGAEANECAIKLARKYAFDKYGNDRFTIVTLKNSFHGRTLFTLTATGQDAFHKYFAPFAAEVDYSAPNMTEMRKVADEHTCAVIIECVQGESGVEALDKTFVKELRAYCTEKDILLICDEVQSGNGRTGKYFAYEHYGITPDIVTTAKGLGGGLPLGACLFFDKTEHTLQAGDHGSTFGGNPVCCAGAISVVERLDEKFLLEVQGKSEYLRTKLKGLPNVERVSGIGMMIGLQTNKSAKEIAQKCLERGLLVLTAHSKVRIVPPLNITKTEIDEGLTILREVLSL